MRRTLKLILSSPSAPTHLEGLNGIIDNRHPPPHPPTCLPTRVTRVVHMCDPGGGPSSWRHSVRPPSLLHQPPAKPQTTTAAAATASRGAGPGVLRGGGHGTGSGAAAQCGGGGVGLVGLSYSRVEPQAAVGWRPTSMTSSSTYTHTHTSCHHQTRPDQF